MSVGYNLEGIKQPPMQQFIDNMMDASDHPKFAQYRDTLNKLLEDDAFLARHGLQEKRESLQALPARIPHQYGAGRHPLHHARLSSA